MAYQSFAMLEVKCSENSPYCPLLEKGHCNYGTETEARGLGSSLCHDSLCALISCAAPFPGLETANCTSLSLYKQFTIQRCTGTKRACCLTPLPLLPSTKPPRWQNKDVALNAGFCAWCAAHVWTEKVREKHEELSTGALSGKRGKR